MIEKIIGGMKNNKPLCFGTHMGPKDMLCSKCEEKLKEECMVKTAEIKR